jgi:hypothetical protein
LDESFIILIYIFFLILLPNCIFHLNAKNRFILIVINLFSSLTQNHSENLDKKNFRQTVFKIKILSNKNKRNFTTVLLFPMKRKLRYLANYFPAHLFFSSKFSRLCFVSAISIRKNSSIDFVWSLTMTRMKQSKTVSTPRLIGFHIDSHCWVVIEKDLANKKK